MKFQGNYLNGKISNGKFYDNKGKEEFELIEGKGKGKEYNKDGGLKFEGEYLNGKRWDGKGEQYFKDGRILFKGIYKQGKRWDGTEFDSYGEIIANYSGGERHRKGNFNCLII